MRIVLSKQGDIETIMHDDNGKALRFYNGRAKLNEIGAFRTKKGLLTAYAFACGYIQRYETKLGSVTLWREYGIYHVKRVSKFIDGFRTIQEAWLTFEKLTDARRAFKRQVDLSKT